MKSVVFSEQAREDLRDIHAYIAIDSPTAADTVLDAILTATEALADTPWLSHRREDATSADVYFYAVFKYLIIFERHDPMTVLRVVRGARDLLPILRPFE